MTHEPNGQPPPGTKVKAHPEHKSCKQAHASSIAREASSMTVSFPNISRGLHLGLQALQTNPLAHLQDLPSSCIWNEEFEIKHIDSPLPDVPLGVSNERVAGGLPRPAERVALAPAILRIRARPPTPENVDLDCESSSLDVCFNKTWDVVNTVVSNFNPTVLEVAPVHPRALDRDQGVKGVDDSTPHRLSPAVSCRAAATLPAVKFHSSNSTNSD
ncbi:hypothetical protein Cni_G01517 [Canna indica]|uniref:Uncharacterized protein n=1 Tax=Canna indica TaxID=4628 RepID=A0AAQ3JQP7_9LILI|nr:hypothetical protein Cni_G01517 [Canna indica]